MKFIEGLRGLLIDVGNDKRHIKIIIFSLFSLNLYDF